MHDRLVSLLEQRVRARPTSEDEAKQALEWLARHEGKTLPELVEELRTAHRRDRVSPLSHLLR
jgi:hypothetical protein